MALFSAPKNFTPTGREAGTLGHVVSPKVPRTPRSPAPKPRGAVGHAGSMPRPPGDLQVAQQQVAAAYDPVIQQIKNAYSQMATDTGTAYNAGAKQLADLYGQYGPAVQKAYSQAGQGLAAVQGVLQATQQGQGAAASSDLARQLQGIDANTVGRVTGDFGNALQGQSLANATLGSNNLAMLLSEGAHAGQYGAILPGVGGQIGFRGLEQALGGLNTNQQNELAKLAAEEPGAVQTALSGIQSNRYKQQALGFEQSLKNELAGNTIRKTNASISQGNQRIAQGSQRIGIAKENAATSQWRAQQQNAQAWARIGVSKQRLADAETKAATATKHGGLTSNEVAGLRQKASKDADVLYNGVAAKLRADGSVSTAATYSRTYQDALHILINKYAQLGPTAILRILNARYKPGQFGRPKDDTASKLMGAFAAQGR